MTPKTIKVTDVVIPMIPQPEETHDAVYNAVCTWTKNDTQGLCDSV